MSNLLAKIFLYCMNEDYLGRWNMSMPYRNAGKYYLHARTHSSRMQLSRSNPNITFIHEYVCSREPASVDTSVTIKMCQYLMNEDFKHICSNNSPHIPLSASKVSWQVQVRSYKCTRYNKLSWLGWILVNEMISISKTGNWQLTVWYISFLYLNVFNWP